MKIVSYFLLTVLAAACVSEKTVEKSARVTSDDERNDGKNFQSVVFGTLGGDYEKLIQTDPEGWNSNFRPYGRTSDLKTDPAIIRAAAEGKAEGVKPTALRVSCDERAFT